MTVTSAGATLIATTIPFLLLVIVVESRTIWPRPFFLNLVASIVGVVAVMLAPVTLWNCFIVVNSGDAATGSLGAGMVFGFVWSFAVATLVLFFRLGAVTTRILNERERQREGRAE